MQTRFVRSPVFPLWSGLLGYGGADGGGQLVGAGGAAAFAVYAGQGVGQARGFDAFGQTCQALQVAVAAAGKAYVVYAAFGVNVEVYLAGACPGGAICEMFLHADVRITGLWGVR